MQQRCLLLHVEEELRVWRCLCIGTVWGTPKNTVEIIAYKFCKGYKCFFKRYVVRFLWHMSLSLHLFICMFFHEEWEKKICQHFYPLCFRNLSVAHLYVCRFLRHPSLLNCFRTHHQGFEMPGPTSTTIFRPVTRFFKVVLIVEDFARKKK